MKNIRTAFLFPLTALIILIYAFSSQLFNVPPLGRLLNPFTGAVQNGNDEQLYAQQLAIKTGKAGSPVQVFFDERKVPHIYAKNASDLYFAQGYIVASLRLWQMDFQAYAAAGRLSELFDASEFLDYDRNQRRIGILDAARRSLQLIEKDQETIRALTAYTNGVNAYIKTLTDKSLPLEYKVLDYTPEPWSNLKSVLMMKSMANSMTGFGEDLYLSKMMTALGETRFNQLFPDFYGHSTPVMNNKPPLAENKTWISRPAYMDYAFFSSNSTLAKDTYNPRLGSNSWAVSGNKTKTGAPILANDPHLNLSLPSIWIEMQLNSPGTNVYGVAIPGTPGIIIGFNDNIAWGLTNGADDVKDWYKLKISADHKKYELDGKWLNLQCRIEQIKRRGQSVFRDTVYSTVQGPVVNDESFPGRNPDLADHALKWELHQPSNEIGAFIKLNKANNYAAYKAAIRDYVCPLQNFTFACNDNTIAINHQGHMAVKEPGQGKFILDGTKGKGLYTKYIPVDSLPQLFNPPAGFVLSANQRPTYSNYPYYYDGYYTEVRANRIQQLLENRHDMDIDDMKAMQLDDVNAFAKEALPILTGAVNAQKLNGVQQKAIARLSTWKADYTAGNTTAKLYDLWWKNISDYTWDELAGYRFYLGPPDDYILLDLIRKDPSNDYFDKQGTPQKENAGDIITAAFVKALEDYNILKTTGSVQWADCNRVNLMHLTNLPAFSVMEMPSAGSPDAINAVSANWGPSWRMIVQLGKRPAAYGICPGGQSGNPGSAFYNNAVNDWNKGKYYPLHLFISAEEAKSHSGASWILQ